MNLSDFSFKIVLIGDSGVGKSCFLLRFADDKFNDNFYTTVGVDFRFKSIEVNEKNIKYEIWDTAGQERFKTITSAYYRGADCVIILYDVREKETFNHVYDWIDEVKRMNKDNPLIIVLGNKCDEDKRDVLDIDILTMKERNKIEVIEVSAKKNVNIETTMKKIGVELMKRAEEKKKNIKIDFKASENNGNLGNSVSKTYKLNEGSGFKGSFKEKIEGIGRRCDCG